MPPLPAPLRAGIGVSAAALAVNLVAAVLHDSGVGEAALLELVRGVTMWALVPPIAIALAILGALRHPVGVWHVIALALCWLGDGLGSITDQTGVLLGLFFLATLAYIVALWPTRRRSLAWGWGGAGYGAVGLIAGGVIASNAAMLAAPGLLYALLLSGMAALAAIDTPGLLGGLLFQATVLVLGIGLFLIEIPDAVRAIAVLVLYLGAQALLAVSLQQRLGLGAAESSD